MLKNHINGLHKRTLRLVYRDFSSTFSEFLIEDKCVAIHRQNLQTQTFEMFEVKNNLALEIMKNIFCFKTFPYGLGSSPTRQSRGTKTVLYGSETVSSLGQKIWEI